MWTTEKLAQIKKKYFFFQVGRSHFWPLACLVLFVVKSFHISASVLFLFMYFFFTESVHTELKSKRFPQIFKFNPEPDFRKEMRSQHHPAAPEWAEHINHSRWAQSFRVNNTCSDTAPSQPDSPPSGTAGWSNQEARATDTGLLHSHHTSMTFTSSHWINNSPAVW